MLVNIFRRGAIVMLCFATGVTFGANCENRKLNTKAIYIEHIGDSDKPFYPIVIAEARPSTEELRCVVSSSLSPEVYVVKPLELAKAIGIVRRTAVASSQTPSNANTAQAELHYIIVSEAKSSGVKFAKPDSARRALIDMGKYFETKQPKLSVALMTLSKRIPSR